MLVGATRMLLIVLWGLAWAAAPVFMIRRKWVPSRLQYVGGGREEIMDLGWEGGREGGGEWGGSEGRE